MRTIALQESARLKNAVLPLMFTVSLCLLSACAGSGQTPRSATPLSPGQEIFLNQCVACHMGVGEPPGPNGVILESSHLANEAAFVKFLRKPTTSMMPPFSASQLSDADAGKLYEYLAALIGND